MDQAYVCMNISEYPLPLGRRGSLDEHSRVDNVRKNPNSVFNVKHMLLNKEGPTVRSLYVLAQSFEISADLTVIESYNRFGVYLSSLSKTTCEIVQ